MHPKHDIELEHNQKMSDGLHSKRISQASNQNFKIGRRKARYNKEMFIVLMVRKCNMNRATVAGKNTDYTAGRKTRHTKKTAGNAEMKKTQTFQNDVKG